MSAGYVVVTADGLVTAAGGYDAMRQQLSDTAIRLGYAGSVNLCGTVAVAYCGGRRCGAHMVGRVFTAGGCNDTTAVNRARIVALATAGAPIDSHTVAAG